MKRKVKVKEGLGVSFKAEDYEKCFSFLIERHEHSLTKKEMEVELVLDGGKKILVCIDNKRGRYTAWDGVEKVGEGSLYMLGKDMLPYKQKLVSLEAWLRMF